MIDYYWTYLTKIMSDVDAIGDCLDDFEWDQEASHFEEVISELLVPLPEAALWLPIVDHKHLN